MKKQSYKQRIKRYEEEKRLLQQRNLSPDEYEAAIKEIARRNRI